MLGEQGRIRKKDGRKQNKRKEKIGRKTRTEKLEAKKQLIKEGKYEGR